MAIKICFYSPNAYPLLVKNKNGGYGGAEVKIVLLANALYHFGYEVYIITNEYIGIYSPTNKSIYKKNLIKYSKPKRFNFFITLTNALKAMNEVNADLYFQRAAGGITGIIAMFCKYKNKHFWYMAASSQDVDGNYLKEADFKNKHFYKYGLKNASRIIVQTKGQQKLLLNNHKIKSHFIRDGINIPKIIKSYDEKLYITFIGGIRPVKNPNIFIDLAKKFPDRKFLFIGGALKNQQKYALGIEELAKKEKNIIIKGHINRSRVHHYLSRSILLINTSDREGLPNTVTEAWSYGVPVIGYNINPDKLLNGNLGYFCKGNFNLLVDRVKEMIHKNNIEHYNHMSKRCIKYIIDNHNIEDTSKEIHNLLKERC